jgi:hypothetical protein
MLCSWSCDNHRNGITQKASSGIRTDGCSSYFNVRPARLMPWRRIIWRKRLWSEAFNTGQSPKFENPGLIALNLVAFNSCQLFIRGFVIEPNPFFAPVPSNSTEMLVGGLLWLMHTVRQSRKQIPSTWGTDQVNAANLPPVIFLILVVLIGRNAAPSAGTLVG